MVLTFNPAVLGDEALALIAGQFKVLSHATRLKLLIELERGEQNVTELVKATGVSQANISRHLQALTDAGLVTRRRAGVKIYYCVADAGIFQLCHHVCRNLEKRIEQQASVARLFARRNG